MGSRSIAIAGSLSSSACGLSYSKKHGFVSAIEGAETQETRERRIEKAIDELKRV
jgi:uncharacterized protein YdeI (YjbR/CyaY-like superfamily)